MPELPDIELYLAALGPRILAKPVERARIASPFFVRTVDPPVSALEGKRVRELRRVGKRLVLAFDEEIFAVVHLMIAGRLRWREKGAPVGFVSLSTCVHAVALSRGAAAKAAQPEPREADAVKPLVLRLRLERFPAL